MFKIAMDKKFFEEFFRKKEEIDGLVREIIDYIPKELLGVAFRKTGYDYDVYSDRIIITVRDWTLDAEKEFVIPVDWIVDDCWKEKLKEMRNKEMIKSVIEKNDCCI